MNRKSFISTLGFVTGGSIAGIGMSPVPMAESLIPQFKGNEDDLWKLIKQEFSFPDGYVYLNTGGIGSVPRHVRSFFSDAWAQLEMNPTPGHDIARWNDLKKDLAPLFGSGVIPEEIALISSATEGINIILNGLPLQKGDEIITTTHEHPALNIPLLNLMKRKGVIIRYFEPDRKLGLNNVRIIEDLITKKTRLIFVSHRTTTTGQLLPVREIGELAKSRNLWFALDGAQAPGSMQIDVKGWNVDCYTFSSHKWVLAPRRTGVLYVKKEMQDIVAPMTVGAYSDNGFNIKDGTLTFQSSAQRYEYGTQNELLFFGLHESLKFINSIGIAKIREHNEILSETFYDALKNSGSCELLSPEEREYRSSMITFRVPDKNFNDITGAMGKDNIRVRPVGEAGLNGIRVSFHLFNDTDDLDRAVTSIKRIINK
jgi:selenocysteine lyase/cysteine desulfurase